MVKPERSCKRNVYHRAPQVLPPQPPQVPPEIIIPVQPEPLQSAPLGRVQRTPPEVFIVPSSPVLLYSFPPPCEIPADLPCEIPVEIPCDLSDVQRVEKLLKEYIKKTDERFDKLALILKK
jgi:hypothetical protein